VLIRKEFQMGKLTIVGMGPGGEAYLTAAAESCLTTQKNIFLRTERHPVVPYLVGKGMQYEALDRFYESTDTFEETYDAIVAYIIEALTDRDLIFAVPGNPFVAEKTVSALIAHCKNKNESYEVIHGASFIDAIVTTLEIDPVNGLEILDSMTLVPETLYTGRDLMLIQVYNRAIASDLKVKLSTLYEDDHEIVVIRGAGIPAHERIERIPLYQLDHDETLLDHLTSIYVPKRTDEINHLSRLIGIMKELRSEDGCPWDREQTHESLTKYLIEEAYEVKHAVDHEDDQALVDELGDVLLQIVFHTTIASEEGYFDIQDVVKAVCDKMIRRHPHVFGTSSVENADEVLVNWQAIKDKEKEAKGPTDTMKNISFSLPALMRSQKIQKVAMKVGFEWEDISGALDKVKEEIAEVENAILEGDDFQKMEEIGDLLMVISNVARWLKIDAELALNKANEKFIKRFSYIEESLKRENKLFSESTLEEMDFYWEEAKKWEKS